MRVPWTAKRSYQPILKEVNPEYSLDRLMMMKLKLQHFGHLMEGADELEKTLMLGKMERRRRRGRQRMRYLDSITDSMDMNLSNLQETMKDTEAWHTAVHGVTKIQHNLAIKQHQILAIVSLETQTVPIMIWEVFQPRLL